MKVKELKLYTGNIEKQKQFYENLLGLRVIDSNSQSFSLEVGTTVLRFEKGPENPYYHFALNIPSNQIEQAYEWAKQRVEILPFEGKEIVDFQSWNAKAIYFCDPENNILEFIARRNLGLDSQREFDAQILLHISEVGFPTLDVDQTFKMLNQNYGLEKYSGDFERFCAVGEETGLFIVVDYRKKKWIPNMMEIKPFPFSVIFENEAGNLHFLEAR